jgi:hypothetical protein
VSAAPPPPPHSPPGVLTGGDLDDEVIPEDALEFNPAAGDVNKVFVEPPPNPEWTAATGTFKALVFKGGESEEASEFELDADFLSSTAEMRKLKMGLSEDDSGTQPKLDENNIPGNAAADPTRQRPAAAVHTSTPAPGAQPQFVPSNRSGPTPGTPTGQPQPQLHAFLSESQSQPRLRTSPSETQSQPQLRSPTPQPERDAATADIQAEPRATGRKSVRAFGLDSTEPPPSELRLATLARSRIAPSALELEPPSPLERLTQMLSGSPTLWTSGVALLGVLLVAQIVNHYRDDLAATPQFNKPITALYSALGVKLTPHWDLRAYDVRQLGASVDAQSAGQIMVRASVKNGGRQAQPMPLLRVTLQDRFGNRIAARDVSPGSYLPRAIPAASFLSAGQRIDAEMAFVDPGANAVGFEIDACLPAPAGGIACANDPVSR